MRRYVQHILIRIQFIITQTKTGVKAADLRPINPCFGPIAKVHVDHLFPFVNTATKQKFILVLTGTLTRFVILTAVRDTKTIYVVKALEHNIFDFSAPVCIISHRGTCFMTKMFQDFCSKHGIRHTLNYTCHPQMNGLVERINTTLVPALKANIQQRRQ